MKAGIPDSINHLSTITATTTTTTPSSTTAAAAAEDEALKRNTDCVYFLASPLTCKKGSECEYRHSEDARMNPRDCWYWINSNCLNPKCSFRHPPLDGLLGTPSANSTRSSLPPSLTAAPTQLPVTHFPTSNLAKQQPNPGKQATLCFYFQKGLCLKGDRCPFMHETTMFADNPIPQPPSTRAATFVTEPQILKKALGGLQKCTQQQKIPQANITKPVEVPRPAKAPTQTEGAMLRNGLAVKKSLPQPSSLDDVHSRYRPATVPPVISGNSVRTHRPRQANPLDNRIFQNGKEPDEFLGEVSPGFDVLVDDERRGSNYYRNEDEFGRMTGHEGKQVKSVNEFDYSRSSDYNGPSKFDQEKYKDSRGYDLYGRNPDHYAREQRKPSSERILERPVLPERRGFTRAESPNQVDRSDLRYRLAKQRKVIGGSRSATSPEHRGDFSRRDDRDRHVGDQSYRSHSRRELNSLIPRESSLSNRLQGRIMLPGRSSSDIDYTDSRSERETDGGRNWGRLSPGRLPSSSSQGRLQDRIKRTSEDFTTEGRDFRAPPIRRDELDNNTLNFAGPKRLAELKQPKVHHVSRREQRSTSEDALSFEGPKPLNVILKRKRETVGSGDDPASGNEEEINHREKGEFLRSSSRIEAANHSRTEDVEEEEEGLITTEGDEVQPSEHKESEIEMEEDTMITDKVEEDHELESFDQGYEESEYYEQVEGGEEFKAEEDDTNVVDAEEEEEFSDDEDGDDFAKRIGVMFS